MPIKLVALVILLTLAAQDVAGQADEDGAGPAEPPGLIAAAHPAAVDAGLQVLRAGGNAVDAAIAVQMALNVVEPSESGIGGGAFLMFRNGQSGAITVYDGRETAPSAATADRFTFFGLPVPLWLAVPSGRSVGVPGVVAMLEAAHKEHGQLPWATLFAPAIALADTPQPISPRLQRQIEQDPSLHLFHGTRQQFVQPMVDDEPQLHNPELAATFTTLAAQGATGFYRGALAEKIVTGAQGRWWWPSDMTLEDLANYSPEVRSPVCADYRQWTLCGPPPPSSGGMTLLQIMGILNHTDWSTHQPESLQAWHLFAEASRLAFADRAYIGDPAFTEVPAGLLDPLYLARRAALIDHHQVIKNVGPGLPAGAPEHEFGSRSLSGSGTTGTSHFSVIDKDGHIVSMTSSIEVPFGSRIMVAGFLLNSQLTDFDFDPFLDHTNAANAVAPGKRPRSSMAPFIVLDAQGQVRLAVGSRGGSRIIGYVTKTIIGVLDWGLSLEEAMALPNLISRGNFLELEANTSLSDLAEPLRELGHSVTIRPLESGVHGIEQRNGRWYGAADPRMGGTAKSTRDIAPEDHQ